MVDKNGQNPKYIRYKPYGAVQQADDPDITKYQYTGQENDFDTGLYYYNARFYDPELCRFIQADTVLDGLNRYTYCRNNPIIYNDPTGKIFRFAQTRSFNFLRSCFIAFCYLSKSETAVRIMTAVNDSDRIVEIEESKETAHQDKNVHNKDNGSDPDAKVYWNPKNALVTKDGGVVSPSVGVMHEITHTYLDTEEGKEKFKNFVAWAIEEHGEDAAEKFNLEEEFVTALEAKIGMELEEKAQRDYYKDVAPIDLITDDPTFNAESGYVNVE